MKLCAMLLVIRGHRQLCLWMWWEQTPQKIIGSVNSKSNWAIDEVHDVEHLHTHKFFSTI